MKLSFLRPALLLGCLALGRALYCQAQRYEVFFVTVGSGWYAPGKGNEIHGFSRIRGANASAELVASELIAGGAEYGVEVTSDDHEFVTLADIDQAILKVKSKILAAKPSNPFFVFYIASHGISDGLAWSHFSIPGDFAYRGDPDNLNIDGLSNSTLYAGSLVDELEKLHLPFLVLLDSCSDGREKHFEPTVLSAKATRNLNDVGSVLRVMNEFRNSYPVLFSTMPGKSVSTVANPLVPGSAVNIAPLARRFSLAVHPSLQSGAALSLATFLDKMLSAKLDTLTTPAVTHSPVPSGANALFLVPGGKLHTVDTVAGTGSEMRICCASAPAAEAPMAASLHGIAVHHRREGEYISSCASLHVASPTYNVSVTQPDERDLQIRFEREDAAFHACFSIESAKRFETKEYTDAPRRNMADAGHPPLVISGDGWRCGENAGSSKCRMSNTVPMAKSPASSPPSRCWAMTPRFRPAEASSLRKPALN